MTETEGESSRRPAALRELDDVDAVFDALAAPARRQILLVLRARGGSMTSREVAERFDTTWATTSRHLRALEAAGLVDVVQTGRERHYTLAAERLTATAGRWIERVASPPQRRSGSGAE